jgi:hypothetical protein
VDNGSSFQTLTSGPGGSITRGPGGGSTSTPGIVTRGGGPGIVRRDGLAATPPRSAEPVCQHGMVGEMWSIRPETGWTEDQGTCSYRDHSLQTATRIATYGRDRIDGPCLLDRFMDEARDVRQWVAGNGAVVQSSSSDQLLTIIYGALQRIREGNVRAGIRPRPTEEQLALELGYSDLRPFQRKRAAWAEIDPRFEWPRLLADAGVA